MVTETREISTGRGLPMLDLIEVEVPNLPEAARGLRILHLSDLHVRGTRKRFEKVIHTVREAGCDLLAVTGDLMDRPGDETAAADFMNRLIHACSPTIGAVGVWGNHDTPDLRKRLQHLDIHWLDDSAWVPGCAAVSVMGLRCKHGKPQQAGGDMAATLLDEAAQRGATEKRFRLLLSHMPNWLPAAAAGQVDLMLSGHTHAGQCRLPTGHTIVNATPRWPVRFSSGIVSYGPTQCAISRGIGETGVTGLRFFARPQIPLYIIRKAKQVTEPVGRITRTRKW